MKGSALFFAATCVLAANVARAGDLREFTVGEQVSSLPQAGYQDFACAAEPSRKLSGWRDYAKCPADARGLHEVAFRYDDTANPLARLNEDAKGTKVAGHPVLLALMIGGDGVVHGIHIATDASARLYMHKKAFLLADQVRARFGESGWKCQDGQPTADKVPLGGEFIDRRCEKEADGRQFLLHQELWRPAGKPLDDFVSATDLLIMAEGK
jgi:hypothetical protein